MAVKNQSSNLFRNLVVTALGLLYLLISAYCMVTSRDWINRPFPGFLVLRNNYVSTFFRGDWPGNRAGLRNLDIILSANGRPVKDGHDLYHYISTLAPGTQVVYDVQSGKERVSMTIPVKTFTLSDWVFVFPLAMFVGLYGFLSGLIILFIKPKNAFSWYLFIAFASVGLLFATNGERVTSHHIFFPIYVPCLAAASFLLFALNFPAKARRARAISIAVLCALVAVLSLYTRAYFTGANFSPLDRVSLVFTLISFFFSVYFQVRSYVRSADPVIRQKIKLVIIGFVAAFLGFSYIFIFAIMQRKMNLYYTIYHLAPIPLFMGYAIVKHGLFDLDIFIRRTASYVMVSGIVILAFFGLTMLLSLVLQNFTGQSSQIAAVVSTLLVVMMFRPLRTRIDRTLDKKFFRERYEYTATIRKASGILAGLIDLDQLLNQLLNTVMDAIKIERGLIFLKEKDREEFCPAVTSGYAADKSPAAIDARHPLITLLESAGRPLQISDSEEFGDNRELIARMMQGSGITLLVPAIYERRLIGILALGEKKSGAWYSKEDQELLQTLMIQTAVSIENARKVQELKKMVELEISFRELQKLDKMKDDFLSMVSHDLRTPMTSIKGYASILSEKIGRLDQDRQLRYLGIIIKESERLTRLINDLLDLQRFEAGRMVLNLQPVDIVQLARESLESFQGAALARKQVLEADLPERQIMVNADADRVSQVVANLLSNATKFTPESGKIVLSIAGAMLDGKPGMMVSVKDSGPGIPEEAQSRLFSKFQQVEKGGAKSEQKGSGLGLALVREIAEHHGGKAGVESEPGQGARFYFILPVPTKEGANA